MVSLPSTEAEESLADLAKKVADKGEPIVIEHDGEPPVALVPLAELQRLQNGTGRPDLARRALEIGGLGYWIWDNSQDCYLVCSDELAGLFGLSLEEYLAGRSTYSAHLDHIHPDDRERYDREQRDAERDVRPYQIEFREWVAGAGYRHFRESGYPVHAAEGACNQWVGVVQDISEVHSLSRRLDSSESFYQSLFEQGVTGVATLSPSGVFQQVNPAFCAMLGYRPDELSGRCFDQVIAAKAEGSAEGAWAALMKAQSHGRLHNLCYRHKDGRSVWGLSGLFVRRSADGTPMAAVIQVQNITERVEAERSLSESEAALKRAQSQARIGSWRWDVKCDQLVSCSEQYAEILGMPMDQVPQRTDVHLDLVVHPDDRSRVAETYEAFDRSHDGYEVAYRLVRPDGSVRRVVEIGEAVKGEQGELVEQFGVLQDITEHKRNEVKLQEQQALLEQAAEMANLGHWVWDERLDRCTYCSEFLARMNGLTAEEYLAVFGTMTDLLESVHPDDRERYARVIAEAREQASGYDLEFRDLAPNGEYRYLRERGEPLLDEGGKLVATIGTLQDVSDYKRTETALREARAHLERTVAQRTAAHERANEALRGSEARLKAFIDHSPSLISLKDTSGRYFLVNRAFERLYGVSADDHLGKRAREVMPEPIASQVEDMDRLVLATGEGKQQAITGHYAGETRIFDVNKFPIRDDEGELLGIGTVVTEITEKKRAEEELKAREAQLRQAQVIAKIGVFIWDDIKDRPIRYSKELADLFGLSEAEMLADRRSHEAILGYLAPEDRQNYDRVVEQAARDLAPYAVEYRMRDGLGRVRYWRETGEPVVDGQGRLVRTFGTVQDITEIRRAEEALRESNERFRSVVDGSPAAIFLKDPQGRFLLVNRCFETWYGWSEADVVGKTSWEVYPRDYAGIYTDMDRKVLETGEICEHECLVPFADGRNRLVQVTKFPVREPDGRISAIGTINTDLSDRQLAQQRVRESEQRLSLAVQLSKLGHWIWDPVEDRCLFCSQEHARLYELSVAAFVERAASGSRRFAMVHPEDRERVEAAFAALRAGERIELEYRVVTSSQAVRHVREIAASFSGADGTTVQEHGVTQDITEQKLAEDRLYQAQKMEAVGQLTGGISHDFNNLLAIIQGNAEFLSEELGEDKPEVEEILGAVMRGAALTQHLLAFSRQQPLDPQPVHLGGLVIGMAPLLERTLGEAIEVQTRVPDDLWIVKADGGQVENALLNLAINARDAMAGGGWLTVECRNQRLDADYVAQHPDACEGDHVVLAVSDDGSGMGPEVLAHAFEPFFTTKELGQGSGLGLSMVYGFARQSGGHATIDSTKGRGTTVSLFLPRSTAVIPQSELPAVEREVARGRNEMILLLEDDAEVRALDKRLLLDLGYRVLEAENARQAESLMADEAVDLLLSDVVLPGGISGPQFAERAGERDPALKVVFMSGYPAEAAGGVGLCAEDRILLTKPFRRQELAQALRRALER